MRQHIQLLHFTFS